jgi:serine protease Do
MSVSTNQLVAKARKAALPTGIATSLALAAVMLFNHNGVHAAMVSSAPLDNQSVAALTSLDQAMETLAARVSPAVVNVAVTSKGSAEDNSGQNQSDNQSDQQGQGAPQGLPPGLAQFFGFGQDGQGGNGQGSPRMQQPQQPQLEHGIGSGILISPDGYIVTNNHVVDGAVSVKVTLHDRRIYNAKVVGVDKLTDLAVLKIDGHDLPNMSWGDSSKLEPGQTVLAFGSPFGYFQDSVTRGIVSAVNRANPYSDDARKPGGYIQTDAAINPGNSGGALVDAHGELIGINTFIISNSGSFAGAGFAIPSQIAEAVTRQIIAHGKVEHGYLGISMNDVTPGNAHFFNLQDATGAIIAQVMPDSPASRAGLKTGDVITQLNGHKVLNGGALQVAISEVSPGANLALGIMRNGSPTNVNVTLGDYHAPGTQVAGNDGAGPQSGKLGLSVGDLTADTRQQINAPDQVKGAVVESVRPGSPAEDAGLQAGDVILEVNRQSTSSANQFVSQVHQNPAGKDLLLLVWSHGNASYRTVSPEQNNG